MRHWISRSVLGFLVFGAGVVVDARVLAAAPVPQRLLDQPRDSDRRSDEGGPKETEVVDRRVALPEKGTLRIKNFSGDIRITSSGGRDVVLRATRRASRETLDHVKLDVASSGSSVTIEANRRDPSWEHSRRTSDVVETEMTLEVPASADLDIDAFSSDVTIDGMNADQRIKTFSGTITVRGLKGEIDANTFSADIRVTVDSASKGSVSFDSFSGRLESELTISSLSGHRGNRVEGTLRNGAGPRLRFHTFSGDVELRTR